MIRTASGWSRGVEVWRSCRRTSGIRIQAVVIGNTGSQEPIIHWSNPAFFWPGLGSYQHVQSILFKIRCLLAGTGLRCWMSSGLVPICVISIQNFLPRVSSRIEVWATKYLTEEQKNYKSDCVSYFWKQQVLVPSSSTVEMPFKKSLAALVLALPVVFGMHLFFKQNIVMLIRLAGLPSKRGLNPKCEFLQPILTDLVDNLFTNECGDTVSLFFSPYYEHLSNNSYRLTELFVSVSMMPSDFPQP